jgi:hypothetical protein
MMACSEQLREQAAIEPSWDGGEGGLEAAGSPATQLCHAGRS